MFKRTLYEPEFFDGAEWQEGMISFEKEDALRHMDEMRSWEDAKDVRMSEAEDEYVIVLSEISRLCASENADFPKEVIITSPEVFIDYAKKLEDYKVSHNSVIGDLSDKPEGIIITAHEPEVEEKEAQSWDFQTVYASDADADASIAEYMERQEELWSADDRDEFRATKKQSLAVTFTRRTVKILK